MKTFKELLSKAIDESWGPNGWVDDIPKAPKPTKGSRYSGEEYEKEETDEPKKKPETTEPVVKRGRGRPAGSVSQDTKSKMGMGGEELQKLIHDEFKKRTMSGVARKVKGWAQSGSKEVDESVITEASISPKDMTDLANTFSGDAHKTGQSKDHKIARDAHILAAKVHMNAANKTKNENLKIHHEHEAQLHKEKAEDHDAVIVESLDDANDVSVEKKNFSWGKLVTVRRGSAVTYPLHPEHQEQIKNLKDKGSTKYKDETGATIFARREGDTVTLKKTMASPATFHISHLDESLEESKLLTFKLQHKPQVQQALNGIGHSSFDDRDGHNVRYDAKDEEKIKQALSKAGMNPFNDKATSSDKVRTSDFARVAVGSSMVKRAGEIKKNTARRLKRAMKEDVQLDEVSVQYMSKYSKDGNKFALWRKGNYHYELTHSSQGGKGYKHVKDWYDKSHDDIHNELINGGYTHLTESLDESEIGSPLHYKQWARDMTHLSPYSTSVLYDYSKEHKLDAKTHNNLAKKIFPHEEEHSRLLVKEGTFISGHYVTNNPLPHHVGTSGKMSLIENLEDFEQDIIYENLKHDATHVFHGTTEFMKPREDIFDKNGIKVHKSSHNKKSGMSEYFISGKNTDIDRAAAEFSHRDRKNQNFWGVNKNYQKNGISESIMRKVVDKLDIAAPGTPYTKILKDIAKDTGEGMKDSMTNPKRTAKETFELVKGAAKFVRHPLKAADKRYEKI